MSETKAQAKPPRLSSKIRRAAPPDSLRYRFARMMEARTWQQKVMAAVGTWWFSEPDGVPSARTLRYGTVYERGAKSKPQRFATFGHAPVAHPGQEVDIRIITSNNDGFELWFGTPNEWAFHLSSDEVQLLFRYLVWEWFIRARWLGLRRWIYYRALHSHVSSFKGRTS